MGLNNFIVPKRCFCVTVVSTRIAAAFLFRTLRVLNGLNPYKKAALPDGLFMHSLF